MSEECVIAVYDSLQSAEQALHELDRSALPNEQVSLVTRGPVDQPEIIEDLTIGDDSLRDAAAGAGLGGVIGMLSGLTVAAVTAPASFVFIAGAMAGMFTAVAGALLGALAGWGVHHDHIGHYEQLVKDGKVIVIVHGDPLVLAEANRLFRLTDAKEVHTHAKTSAESPEVEQS